MVTTAGYVNQGELPCTATGVHAAEAAEEPGAAAVRASIVAAKSRNGEGAKGGRAVDE